MNKLLTLLALASATAAIATPQAHADEPKFLGVYIQRVQLPYPYMGFGMRIVQLMPDSPAGSIGLKPGDIITGINGVRIRNHYDVQWAYSTLVEGRWTPVDVITAEGKPWRPWAIKGSDGPIALYKAVSADVQVNAPPPALSDSPVGVPNQQPMPISPPQAPPLETNPPVGTGFPRIERPY